MLGGKSLQETEAANSSTTDDRTDSGLASPAATPDHLASPLTSSLLLGPRYLKPELPAETEREGRQLDLFGGLSGSGYGHKCKKGIPVEQALFALLAAALASFGFLFRAVTMAGRRRRRRRRSVGLSSTEEEEEGVTRAPWWQETITLTWLGNNRTTKNALTTKATKFVSFTAAHIASAASLKSPPKKSCNFPLSILCVLFSSLFPILRPSPDKKFEAMTRDETRAKWRTKKQSQKLPTSPPADGSLPQKQYRPPSSFF